MALHLSTFLNMPTAAKGDEQDKSDRRLQQSLEKGLAPKHYFHGPATDKGSHSSEGSSLVSEISEGISKAINDTNNKEVKAQARAALVAELFRPREKVKPITTEEASFLPRLLDRVNFPMWSQTPAKNLNSEIQSLKGQQSAAAQLLDEIEEETKHINQRLQEKSQQAKVQSSKAFLSIECTTCGPSLDANEINLQARRPLGDDTIELRPLLRSRIRECEQALDERGAELRQLRHEIQLLRCEKEMQDEKDAVLRGPMDTKATLLQKYGAAFSFVDGSQMKVAFLAWRHHVLQRASRERMMKRTSFALACDAARQNALLFTAWQRLVRDKREAQKLKQERQRLTIGQRYAAKFAMQAESTSMRAIVIEWWRICKESALQARIAAAQAKRDAAVKEGSSQKQGSAWTQGAAAHKACCALM